MSLFLHTFMKIEELENVRFLKSEGGGGVCVRGCVGAWVVGGEALNLRTAFPKGALDEEKFRRFCRASDFLHLTIVRPRGGCQSAPLRARLYSK